MPNPNGNKISLWLKVPGAIVSVILIYFYLVKPLIPKSSPLVGIVGANYFSIPKVIPETNNLRELNHFLYIRIQNEGSEAIKNVVFDFATASYIEKCSGYKCRDTDGAEEFQNIKKLPLGDFLPGHTVDISMWMNYSTDKYRPEEITEEIMNDINIKYSDEPFKAKIFSYYSDEGKKRLSKFEKK
jgi:hypothetical protein